MIRIPPKSGGWLEVVCGPMFSGKSEEMIRRLLDDDPATANSWSPDGFTALHLAIFGGSEEAVRLLLERGADPNALATDDEPATHPRPASNPGRPTSPVRSPE